MPSLSLQLLGPFTAMYGGRPLRRFRTRSVQALLIYLVCQPEPHRRERLMALLWPEASQQAAQNSLRQAIYYLRQAIPQVDSAGAQGPVPFLASDRQVIRVNPEAVYELDVRALEQGLRGPPDGWPAAVALYRDDFLCDTYLPDSAPFEEWAAARRADFKRRVLEALASLADQALAAADPVPAQAYARRQLAIDDLGEGAHQQLMVALAMAGQRTAALAQYEAYRDLLAAELGAAPTGRSEAVYQQILAGEFEPDKPWPAAAIPPAWPAFLDPETSMERRPPAVFVAREPELARMEALLVQAAAGRGAVCFVIGSAGRGKTALLTEFGRRAQEAHPDLLVAGGSCNAYAGIGDPYLPFRELMGMLTGDVEAQWAAGAISQAHAQRLWQGMPLALQALAEHGPHLANAFLPGRTLLARARAAAPNGAPWLAPLRRSVGREATGFDGVGQSQLFQQFSNVLRALAQQRPILLLLDDLQWADAASISLLFHLGRRLPGSRILVAGAYRSDEVALGRDGERHPLQKVLAELKRQFGDVWIDLGAGDEAAGRSFVQALLETEPNRLGEGFRAALADHTKGHPLFTVELLRAMQARGDLVQDDTGRWIEGAALDWKALPARVEAVIEERLGRLDDDLRQTLAIASVEGETFTAQVVARVQDLEERKLFQALSQELAQRHRLVRGERDLQLGGQHLWLYRFAHVLFQKYLYDQLSPGECQLLHREVAVTLESLYQGQVEAIAAQLARHFSLGGDDRLALKYHTVAAAAAFDAYANAEAESHFRQALALSPSEYERSGLLPGLGLALYRQDRNREAFQVLGEGLNLHQSMRPDEADKAAKIYRVLSEIAGYAGDRPEGHRILDEGLAALAGAPAGAGVARFLTAAGTSYLHRGLGKKALALYSRALAVAESAGAVDVQSYTLCLMAIAPGQTKADPLELLRKSAELAEASPDSFCHHNLGVLHPDPRRRIAYCRSAVRFEQALGFAGYGTLTNLVASLLPFGELAEAEANLREIRRRLVEQAEPAWDMLGYCLQAEAHFQAYRGEWREAARLQRKALAKGHLDYSEDSIASNLLLAFSLMELCTLAGEGKTGDWEEARALLVEAIKIRERLYGDLMEMFLDHRYPLIKLHACQGEIEEARSQLVRARHLGSGLPSPFQEARLASAEAWLAVAEERWPAALSSFAAAHRIFGELGMGWEQARILIDWSAAYTGRGEPADLEQASELLRESNALFQKMGAPGYVAVTEKRLQSLEKPQAALG